MNQDKSRIEIIKMPKDLDPDKILSNRMKEEYYKCPFCGNEGKYSTTSHKYSRGDPNNPKITDIFYEENRYWKRYEFECNCGAKWASPYFPDELAKDKKEIRAGFWYLLILINWIFSTFLLVFTSTESVNANGNPVTHFVPIMIIYFSVSTFLGLVSLIATLFML